MLGQTLPRDRKYPMCSKPFTQLQFLISREVICGYTLDCPANCWMPEETGGECAAAGCVGFSFWFRGRAGGWVFKVPQDPDTICCGIGCVRASFCARRPPYAFWNSHGSLISCCLLQVLRIMRLGRTCHPAEAGPDTIWSKQDGTCLCWGSEGTYSSYRLFSSIAQFSLPPPSLQ